VNPANGDSISYIHLNRPEFEIFGKKFRFHWKGCSWHYAVLRHCRWLRTLMPTWHAREKAFLDWYMNLVDTCDLHEPHEPVSYSTWLDIFKTPEPVTGYREVRYPKQEAARQRVAELQHALNTGTAESKFRGARTVSLTGQVMGSFRE